MQKRLGEILVDNGLTTQDKVDEGLRVQVGGNRRLGYILLKMGVISGDQLLDVLSQQMAVPIITIENEFSKDVAAVLPRYLCRKYTVLPVSKGSNNILNIAMMDPSDNVAISDIENYTGMVVKPMLARENDISAAIASLIPFSANDIFNPQVYGRAAKIATSVAIVLLLVVGWASYQYIDKELHGTVKEINGTTAYSNHDLILGVEGKDKISLLGHGAYTKGFYSVNFTSVEALKTFIEQKRKNFSDKQADWLYWVIKNRLTGGSGKT
ncbi:MAG: hypothetical protein KKD63_11815 [Proteobacteria bacterium]|nr:hypothetical protein [Pseudomonadota bacterium]